MFLRKTDWERLPSDDNGVTNSQENGGNHAGFARSRQCQSLMQKLIGRKRRSRPGKAFVNKEARCDLSGNLGLRVDTAGQEGIGSINPRNVVRQRSFQVRHTSKWLTP